MFNREPENDLLDILKNEGIGCIAFSPLAQGLLTDRYLNGIPNDSRAAKSHGFLKREEINEENLKKIRSLNYIAQERDQSLSQLALSWALRDKRITSVLIGVSSIEQLETNIDALNRLDFLNQELDRINDILEN